MTRKDSSYFRCNVFRSGSALSNLVYQAIIANTYSYACVVLVAFVPCPSLQAPEKTGEWGRKCSFLNYYKTLFQWAANYENDNALHVISIAGPISFFV